MRSAAEGVIVSVVTATLTWTFLAASFVVGLAAVVRMAGPGTGGPDPLTGAIRLPELVTATIVTLFTLAALVFLIALVRRMRARQREEEEGALGPEAPRLPAWLRAVTQILSLVYFLVLAYLLWRGAIPLAGMLSLGHGAGASGAMPQPTPLGAPPVVTWTFGLLAITAGCSALILALWVAFSDRLTEWWQGGGSDAPAPLAVAVAESLDDLRAESDARRAIIRCYARFERVAASSGVERQPWHTPMEFMREALARLAVPRGAVPALTGLFELARFSHRALGREERDRALDALDEIKAAIAEGRANAATR